MRNQIIERKQQAEVKKAGWSVDLAALIIITMIDGIMGLGYMTTFHGSMVWKISVAVLEVVLIISLLANYIVYFRKKSLFKQVSLIGYVCVYAVALFTAHNDLVFAIMFPIVLVYILYFDQKLINGIAITFGLINILDILFYVCILQHMPSKEAIDSVSILLQISCVGTFLFAIVVTTRISNRNNEIKIASLNDEKEKGKQLLADVLAIVERVKKNSTEAESYIEELRSNVESNSVTINNISEGNNQNAESIQKQTMMTENIQNMILTTKNMSNEMLELAKESEAAVTGGQESVSQLKKQGQENMLANQQVVEAVERLVKKTKEVEAITSQIFSISSQTNLLALNASIESARAGDAGRGFAVVAEEIRALADETRNLTENIQGNMESLRIDADQTKEIVDKMIKSVQTEYHLIEDTNEEFIGIGTRMNRLGENVQAHSTQINAILESNHTIVDSILKISAVSQEVAASAEQLVEVGEGTKEKAQKAQELMVDLVHTVKMIDKYTQE